MKSFFAIALATAVSAVALPDPVPQAGSSFPLPFKGKAVAAGKPIDGQFINANGLKFWIGKPTTTSCPEGNAACTTANKNETIFGYLNGESKLQLLTQVPDGQKPYVTKGDAKTGQLAGELRFTKAHSTETAGPALYEGFSIVYDARFQFEGKDWFACPVDNFKTGYGVWAQSRVAGANAGKSCISFEWRVDQQDDKVAKAWQYV